MVLRFGNSQDDDQGICSCLFRRFFNFLHGHCPSPYKAILSLREAGFRSLPFHCFQFPQWTDPCIPWQAVNRIWRHLKNGKDFIKRYVLLCSILINRQLTFLKLVKARAVERKRAIAEGKMDDPLVPKRLEDAITIVGTCMDMCPRFERYRRERENNLFEWESVCNLLFSLSLRDHLDVFQDSWNQTSRSQSRRKNV